MHHCLRFELLEAENTNERGLDFALFDRSRQVGEVRAHVATAGESETLRVSEISVKPAYEAYRYEFLARWRDLVARSHPHLAIEIEGDEPQMQRWRALDAPAFEDLGYRLDQIECIPGGTTGVARYLSRWEAAPPPSLDPRSLRADAEYRVGEVSYQVRVIRSETHWARLEPFWDELLQRTPAATGMQSLEYQRAWWTCFGLASRLWIVTIWRDGALEGIAPLRIGLESGPLRWIRELTFIGTLGEVDRPTCLFGLQSDLCVSVLLWYLADVRGSWDHFVLFEQDSDAALPRALPKFAASQRCLRRVMPSTSCPYVALNRTFEDYLAARSKQFRKQLRSARRKLETRGEVRATRVSSWPQVQAAIERCFRHRQMKLHGRCDGNRIKRRLVEHLLKVGEQTAFTQAVALRVLAKHTFVAIAKGDQFAVFAFVDQLRMASAMS